MSLTTYGTNEAGGGIETALAATTAMAIQAQKECRDTNARTVQCSVVSDVAIRLNYLFSPDNGTTWVVGKQVASAAVTVDGGTATYTNAAQMNVVVGYRYKIEVYNTTGGAGKIVYEIREYDASQ